LVATVAVEVAIAVEVAVAVEFAVAVEVAVAVEIAIAIEVAVAIRHTSLRSTSHLALHLIHSISLTSIHAGSS